MDNAFPRMMTDNTAVIGILLWQMIWYVGPSRCEVATYARLFWNSRCQQSEQIQNEFPQTKRCQHGGGSGVFPPFEHAYR